MYLAQNEALGFDQLLEIAPAGVRAEIQGIAQRALREAGVDCSPDEQPGSYVGIIGREALQALPGIRQAQGEIRDAFAAHFDDTRV